MNLITAKDVQKVFNKKIRAGLPQHKKDGTNRDWIKGFELIRNWNWAFYSNEILKRDNYTCQDCRNNNNNGLEVHHIIPKSRGGSDHPHNLKSLCKKCHSVYTRHLARFKTSYDEEQKKLNEM